MRRPGQQVGEHHQTTRLSMWCFQVPGVTLIHGLSSQCLSSVTSKGVSAGGRGAKRTEPRTETYHVETSLPDGRQALLLDIGSVGNLAGYQWVKEQAAAALAAGRTPEQKRRARPLTISERGMRSATEAQLRQRC